MKKRGFTVIELLIVVAVMGIVVAIALPNILTALQKSKLKSTMADMKTIGNAVSSYMIDNYMAPGGGSSTLLSQVEPYLIGMHARQIPVKDGWGTPFQYESGNVGSRNQDNYSIISFGRDHVSTGVDVAQTEYVVNSMDDFQNDICFSNGNFTYSPKIK